MTRLGPLCAHCDRQLARPNMAMLEYYKACIFYPKKKCFSFRLRGILLRLKPDRLLAEIVCDILFVFEIHSITNLSGQR